MNQTLGVTAAEATTESPALLPAGEAVQLCAWYGTDELPAFRWQAEALQAAWGSERAVAMPLAARNHFTIIEALATPHGAILRQLLD